MSPARVAARHPLLVIALHLAVAAVAAVGLTRLRQSDELLDFIPPGDADVKAFNDVNQRFGALRVALIGVEARPGDDVFAPDVLRRIGDATTALKGVRGVDRVLSLTSMVDFVASEEAVQVTPLVDGPPATPAARAALRARVMSREHVVGQFVSRDGRAALILVFLAAPAALAPDGHARAGDGASPSARTVAYAVRDTAAAALGDLRTTYGGAPFAAATIYDEAQSDIRRLSPFAALLILGVILVAFRDPVGVGLTIACVGWAGLCVFGAMGFLGEPSTVVSGTLPVILFASGSSYAVHVLGRYYALGGRAAGGSEPAIVRVADVVTPPVLIAGLTTAAGFLSFVVMDIRPMRVFGVECAAGVLLCVVASLTLVPAVITLWPRAAAPPLGLGRLGESLAALGEWSLRRRGLLLALAGVAAVASVGPMLRVEVRMEPRAFFRKGSDPWRAEQLLDEAFGGSQFLQVALAGDLADPAALREVKRLEQFAASLPDVTQVQSIVGPLELVSEAMGSGHHLPATRAQALNLLFFVEGEPSLRMVLSPARDAALVHIRVRGEAEGAMRAVEGWLAARLATHPAWPTATVVAERLRYITDASRVAIPSGLLDEVVAGCKLPPLDDPAVASALRDAARATLRGEGGVMARVDDAALVERVAAEVAAHPGGEGPARAALVAASPSPEEGALAVRGLDERVRDRWRQIAVERAAEPLRTRLDARAHAAVLDALLDLLPLAPPGPPRTTLTARLAGEPVLERGLSRSVARNQTLSLVVALVAVLGLMALLFRSAWLAVASVFPSALTMAIVFGAMGALGVRIDIGTSLVASIATGAGSDFAMHYLWYMRRATHREVVKFVGPIMVVSAVLVALGFAVLALGKAQPMRLFGSMAALSMGLAAALTFLLVPALVGRLAPPARPDDALETRPTPARVEETE